MQPTDLQARARDLLRSAADKAKRSGNVPFPPEFVRDEDDNKPPLVRLIQGGRGGEVRLKLYLCITMMATRAPYDLTETSPTPMAWARLLALHPDTGPRRISSNLKWLQHNNFISLTSRVARPPVITLLNAAGGGGPYVHPRETGPRYVGIPVELWTHGWILELSATGLALLFVLKELLGGADSSQYVTRHRRESYGLSPDTWTRARRELETHQLLVVKRTPQGSDFDYQRMRNTYWINDDRIKSARPGSPPSRPR